MVGAMTVYFCVLVQSFYPLIYALFHDAFKIDMKYYDPSETPYYHFGAFSDTYVAILLYFALVLICMKKDLTIFMKMGSVGAFCVTFLIIFVIIYGFMGIGGTHYKVYATPGSVDV